MTYEDGWGSVRFCQWADRRDAVCHVTGAEGSVRLGWTDLVTRNARCPRHRLDGQWVSSGRHCFAGPLVVTTISYVGWYRP